MRNLRRSALGLAVGLGLAGTACATLLGLEETGSGADVNGTDGAPEGAAGQAGVDGAVETGELRLEVAPAALEVRTGGTARVTLSVKPARRISGDVKLTAVARGDGGVLPLALEPPPQPLSAAASQVEVTLRDQGARPGRYVVELEATTVDAQTGQLVTLRAALPTRVVGVPGTLDTSWGRDGQVDVAPLGVEDHTPGDFHELADGRLLVVGTGSRSPYKLLVMRLTAEGALDPSFGAGSGFVADSVSGISNNVSSYLSTSLAPLRDGSFVVGLPGSGYLYLAHVFADGRIEQTWAGSGALYTTIRTTSDLATRHVVVTGGDRLLVGGAAQSDSSSGEVRRYYVDAGLDPAFGTAGIRKERVAGSGDGVVYTYAKVVGTSPAGSVLLAGSAVSNGGVFEGYRPFLWTMTADGQDPVDGGASASTVFLEGDAAAKPAVPQSDWTGIAHHEDGTLVAGHTPAQLLLGRYPAGSFRAAGAVELDGGAGSPPVPRGLTVEADGHFLLAIRSRVFRFTRTGQLDTSFGVGGSVEVPGDVVLRLALTEGGRLLYVLSDAGNAMRVSRYWLR